MKTIVFQGDSITDFGRNYQDPLSPGWGYALFVRAMLDRMYPQQYICYNRGHNGDRVSDLYARERIDGICLKPDVVSFLIGVNDVWHGLDSDNGTTWERFRTVYVLFGEYDFVGRLTTTVPYYTGQWPLYYNHPNTGRPTTESEWTCKYRDAPLFPLYCFGYGLSYTTFAYTDMTLQTEKEALTVSVKVKNTGERAGVETVQCYVHRQKATRVRPVKELKGYAKVALEPDEEKTVSVTLPRELLGYFNEQADYITDESAFDIWMAHDSTCELGCHTVVTF